MKFEINNIPFEFSQVSDKLFFCKTLVTQYQWRVVASLSKGRLALNPSRFNDFINANCPVEQVSWEDCKEFCRILNNQDPENKYFFRLPTKAEWESACGPIPEELEEREECAWYDETANSIKAVGLKKPNKYGLFDMFGNVWEWCEDELITEGSSVGHVMRGGAFWLDSYFFRRTEAAHGSSWDCGFRIVAETKK